MLLGGLLGVGETPLPGPTVPALAVTVAPGGTLTSAAELVRAIDGGAELWCRSTDPSPVVEAPGRDAQEVSNISAATSVANVLRRIDTGRLVFSP
jgi:hypothetical protein